jgi:hypothetical protein
MGTNSAGANLGNSAEGLLVASSGNTIGGTDASALNVIAFNGFTGTAGHRNGVLVESGTANRIQSRIYANSQLGIDLNPADVTVNDAGDADTGVNDLQNFPVLTGAESGQGVTTVTGTLDSEPDTTYRLELFESGSCDSSGFGEGNNRIYTGHVKTDATGHVSFRRSRSPERAVGTSITATATDPTGNTSEFSACRQVTAAPAAFASFEPEF